MIMLVGQISNFIVQVKPHGLKGFKTGNVYSYHVTQNKQNWFHSSMKHDSIVLRITGTLDFVFCPEF
jgi:hypothetical protein